MICKYINNINDLIQNKNLKKTSGEKRKKMGC